MQQGRNKRYDKKPSSIDSFLNHYFDHIYVVNLKHQISDRLIVSRHLNKYGIDFEILEATNGFSGETLDKYREYQQQELGSLKKHPEYNKREIERGHLWIDSPGAMGYIYTYLRILEDAKKNKYKRFLILEDDILLSKNFESEFKIFVQNIAQNWKILLLGASQDKWNDVDLNRSQKDGFYFPRNLITQGSFAMALDLSIVNELIEAESVFEGPFDTFPIGKLYEKYLGKCFVAYPNIVIADVSTSTLRESKCQDTLASKMKWSLEKFDYPLNKPSIAVIIKNKNNLKYYSNFSKTKELPFNLRLYFNSIDGLHPLHNIKLLDKLKNKIKPFDDTIFVPKSDYVATIDEKTILTESDIINFLEYKLSIKKENITPLKTIKPFQRKIIYDRVSVIISTYQRVENLKNALTSVLAQDYHDIEIIVVSNHNKDSNFLKEIKQLVSSFYDQNSACNILLLENTQKNESAAKNMGILNSTGEYICFLDDDYIYLKNRLSKSIAALMKTPKTTAAVYCGFIDWNSTKNDLSHYKTGDLTLEFLLLDHKKHYLSSNTGTYRRDALINLNGFDESYDQDQELEFHLRYFEYYTTGVVKESLVQLSSNPLKISKHIEDIDIIGSKRKLLDQFSHIIQTYDYSIVKSICEAHSIENMIHISEKSNNIDKIDNNKEKLPSSSEKKVTHVNYVEIREDKNIINFILHPKTNNKQVAFYLFHNNKHIDTQWYSKNMFYMLNKKICGKGNYAIRYFLVNERDRNPAENTQKEIGKSETIFINPRYNLLDIYIKTNFTNVNHKYSLLMKPLSNLTKTTTLKSAYNKLLSLYHSFKR